MDETTANLLLNGPKTHTVENVTVYDVYLQSKLLINMLSFFSEIIIFIIIYLNVPLQSRTNKVMLCLMTADASCFLYYVGKTYVFTLSSFPSQIMCIFDVFETISQAACFLCVLFLLYDDLITTKRLSDRSLLIGFCLGLNIFFVVQCLLWPLKYMYSPVFYMLPIAIFDITIFCMLAKDMKMIWKYVRGMKLKRSTLFRMNVARIFLCSWLLIIIANYFCDGFGMVLTCMGSMPGIITIVYFMRTDAKFAECMPLVDSELPNKNKLTLIIKLNKEAKAQLKKEVGALKTIVLKS